MFEPTKRTFNPGSGNVPPGANGAKPKKGRKHKHSALSECRYRLYQILKEKNHYDAEGGGVVSYATSRAREDILKQGFKALNGLGYKIRNVRNFNNTHMRALARHWESQPLAASTIQLRFSVFRTFCVWIGKNGMVREAAEYLENPDAAKRIYVATEDKGWVAKGIEILPKIEEAFKKDKHVGIQLLLMWAFGLRARESWQFHPVEADKGEVVEIKFGAKNGRVREVPILNPWQQQVLFLAKGYVNDSTGSLIPSRYKRDQWGPHFYRICGKCGISRKHGIVPHGLRHEHANDLYHVLTGINSPVRGGAEQVEKHLLAIDAAAREIIAECLGHSRIQIVGAYCGKKPRKKEAA